MILGIVGSCRYNHTFQRRLIVSSLLKAHASRDNAVRTVIDVDAAQQLVSSHRRSGLAVGLSISQQQTVVWVDAKGTGDVSLPAGAAPAKELLGPDFPTTCQNEPGGCPLIDAGGDCELEIVDSDLTAPTVIRAGGGAKITLVNTKIHGKVDRGGDAVVTGLPDLDRVAADVELSKRFGRSGCDGVLSCYRENESYGNIDGKLVVAIAASGKATDATYEGSAPQKVADCLRALGKNKRISPFDGQPGALSCVYAGSVTPGAQMMNSSPSFTRHR